MKNFRVRLSRLDREVSVTYHDAVPVYLRDDLVNAIGSCTILVANGHHYGDVTTSVPVNGDLFVYYRQQSTSGYFDFIALHFTENMSAEKPTTQLKEMIV